MIKAWDKYLEQPKVDNGEGQWPQAQEKLEQQQVDKGYEQWPQLEKAVVVQQQQLDEIWLDEEGERRLYETWEQNAYRNMGTGQCPQVSKDWEQNKKCRQHPHVDTAGSAEWPQVEKGGDREKRSKQQSHVINGWDQDKGQGEWPHIHKRWELRPHINKGWEQQPQFNKGWGLQSQVAKGWEQDKRWGQRLHIDNKWERRPHVNKDWEQDKGRKQDVYVDKQCEQIKRWEQWPLVNKGWRQDNEFKQKARVATTSRQWPHVDKGREQMAEVGKEWEQQLHFDKRWEQDEGWGQQPPFIKGWRQQPQFIKGWGQQSQFSKGWEQDKGGEQRAHVSNGWKQSQGWGQRTHVNKVWRRDEEWEQKADVEIGSGQCSHVDKGGVHRTEVNKGCGQQKHDNKVSGECQIVEWPHVNKGCKHLLERPQAEYGWEQSTQLASPSFGRDDPKKIINDVSALQEITNRSTEDHKTSRSLSIGSKDLHVPRMIMGFMATENVDVTEKGINIKLLIDSKANRVLYAEAGKEVIDFLFTFLALPVASIIELITKKNMVGSMGNLYESAESIDSAYVQPNLDRNSLLKPALVLSIGSVPSLPPNVEPRYAKFYRCSTTYHCFVTSLQGTICPQCNRAMKTEMCYLAGGSSDDSSIDAGYVKGGLAKYFVTDELSVMPMSTVSSISLFKKFNVADVSFIENKIINFRTEEGLEILKAALMSQTVLSEVFLWKETNAGMCCSLQPPQKIEEMEDTNMVSESTSTVAAKVLSIKILMDSQTRRVIFAETEKELIDFLFSLLALPVASIIELLNKKNMVGSMKNLYESVENISPGYIRPYLDKNSLLKPRVVLPAGNISLLPPNIGPGSPRYYMCSTTFGHKYVTCLRGTKCPICPVGNYLMCTELSYVAGESSDVSSTDVGYVKGGLQYLVTDELVVIPSPAISRIDLLKKYNVDNVNLFEITFDFGIKEGLQVLKAALQSKTVLTDVFGKKMISEMQ